MRDKFNVILVHNIVVPYRLPLFNAVADLCNLTVFFCKQTAKDRQWEASLSASDDKFHPVFLSHRGNWPFVFNLSLPWQLIKNPADAYIIIDNEDNGFTNLCTIFYAKLRRKPYILWSGHLEPTATRIPPIEFHKSLAHHWPIKNIYVGVINFMNQTLYNHAATFLAYSDMSKEYLLKHGARKRKIYVGTQAMSVTLLPKPAKNIRLNSKKIQLLYLGYLRPEKGIEILLQAMLQLESKTNVELHIVGDGPEKDDLKRLVAKTSNIHFHPYAHTAARANWYSSVDATILPTFWDPWAHTVTESLYYGTPVVVSRSAAASAVIDDGQNGYKFEAGDTEALTKILNSLTNAKIKQLKQYIKQSNNERLYDVAADADNFIKAIRLGIKASR